MRSQKELEYMLSFESMKDFPFERYEKNFTFIVNGKEYHTNIFVADLLSPKIRRSHYFDSSIDRFYINTKDKDDDSLFSAILSLVSFDSRQLKENEINYYKTIFAKLGNKREFLKLSPIDESEITTNNVIERIKRKIKYLQNFNDNDNERNENTKEYENLDDKEIEYMKCELDFICTHFSEIEEKTNKNIEYFNF